MAFVLKKVVLLSPSAASRQQLSRFLWENNCSASKTRKPRPAAARGPLLVNKHPVNEILPLPKTVRSKNDESSDKFFQLEQKAGILSQETHNNAFQAEFSRRDPIKYAYYSIYFFI